MKSTKFTELQNRQEERDRKWWEIGDFFRRNSLWMLMYCTGCCAIELPPAMTVSPENLDFQASRGVGRAFVALHLGYHHYATLLYYQYLDQRRPSTSTKRIFTERCKYHAIAFCELICMAAKQGAVEALHNVVGHSECLPSSASL